MMEKPPLGCPRAANPQGQKLGSGDPSRAAWSLPWLSLLLTAVCATGFKLHKVY